MGEFTSQTAFLLPHHNFKSLTAVSLANLIVCTLKDNIVLIQSTSILYFEVQHLHPLGNLNEDQYRHGTPTIATFSITALQHVYIRFQEFQKNYNISTPCRIVMN